MFHTSRQADFIDLTVTQEEFDHYTAKRNEKLQAIFPHANIDYLSKMLSDAELECLYESFCLPDYSIAKPVRNDRLPYNPREGF